MTVPIIFEYYLDENTITLSKKMSFDIKTSKFADPYNYILNVCANYNNSASSTLLENIYNTSLTDEASE